jgi:16S rRNA (guanine527-N7)-methyltransferase
LNDELEPVASALGLVLSPAQSAALRQYVDLLLKWNATYNLTAVRDRAGMLTQHLADCLAVVPPLSRHGLAGRLLDVGSGGGLPGVVVATLLAGWDVTCLDAVAKKMAFVRQVAGALGLANLHAEHGRVEALRAPLFDVITCRAFSSLADFVSLTRRQLKPGGVWLAMKGRVPDDEMAVLPPGVEVFHVEPLVVPGLDAHRCLVWLREENVV